VSVEPGKDDTYAVVVGPAASESNEFPAVLHTAREFFDLHTSLRSRIFTHPLPDFPAKPEGLLSETSGGRNSPIAARVEYAQRLQV